MQQVGTTFIIFQEITSLIEAGAQASRLGLLNGIVTHVGMTRCQTTTNPSSHLLEIKIKLRFDPEEFEWILGDITLAGC